MNLNRPGKTNHTDDLAWTHNGKSTEWGERDRECLAIIKNTKNWYVTRTTSSDSTASPLKSVCLWCVECNIVLMGSGWPTQHSRQKYQFIFFFLDSHSDCGTSVVIRLFLWRHQHLLPFYVTSEIEKWNTKITRRRGARIDSSIVDTRSASNDGGAEVAGEFDIWIITIKKMADTKIIWKSFHFALDGWLILIPKWPRIILNKSL